MPRPLEALPEGADFKVVSFKVSARDWDRVLDAIEVKQRASGYEVTLQDYMVEVLQKALNDAE